MTTDNNKERMETIYQYLWSPRAAELLAQLDQSLNPRSSEMLYAVARGLGINRNYTVLDAGSGLGIYSCGLASKFGCHVVGIDLAENNLEMAHVMAREEKVDKLVTFQQGNIQSLPFDDATFDLVWCRDMLVHVRDLQQAFSEFARVLKPDGTVLIHTTFATDLMEPEEYCARVLAALYEAGLRHHANGGMLINYRQLPEAVWAISEYFGVSCTQAEKETMMGITKRHPALTFQDDSGWKHEKANERILKAADRWLYPLYENLESARIANRRSEYRLQSGFSQHT